MAVGEEWEAQKAGTGFDCVVSAHWLPLKEEPEPPHTYTAGFSQLPLYTEMLSFKKNLKSTDVIHFKGKGLR